MTGIITGIDSRTAQTPGSKRLAALAAALLAGMAAQAAKAQGGTGIEEVVVLGSRQAGRSALDIPAPVDTLNAAVLDKTGQTEVGRMLQTLAPSFNFSSSSISDGTDALRPATLRGLGPDQTLVSQWQAPPPGRADSYQHLGRPRRRGHRYECHSGGLDRAH